MTHYDILVIGAGISGIGAAIRLRQNGIENFVILEKGDALGGTWRDNTYPGCACDVPSALYSYSFAPNREWSRLFAGQEEIRRYIERTAGNHGVPGHVQFGTEVQRAQWNEDTRRWTVDTTAGTFTSDAIIAAAGPWNEPLVPDVPGLDTFPGEVFHSSRWNHDFDLTGRRIAVVGTGASAVQFVPAIQPHVAELHLYQRTAQWVLPKPDVALRGVERAVLRRVPGAIRALRRVEYAIMESLGLGFGHPWILKVVQQIGKAQLLAQVRDRELRASLTPDYTLGCKRLLMSNTYYPALTQPNVEVHANAVASVRGNVVVGTDGEEREVDAIVFGTGFHILDMPIGARVFDGEGRSLDDHWKGSPQAYLGTTVAGFPNAFVLLGPALGTGHTSAFMILEAQLDYVMQALTHARSRGWSRWESRREVQDAFNAQVQEALATTVYNAGGCQSYFLDVNGRNSFNWPWSTDRMRRRLGRFDEAAYEVTCEPAITATSR
ncbi:cyclohexanone monooxygenase [Rhodococcus oxybenzonivorans]|uniref:Cyclohexanone monooxygenase n=1 Tax=Rhodococcus oxybenzonivorans TaxID=1990687 RepID=A0A2S2BSU6_9NOCA|nr:NAD(P)/FAD-dependent oxidoreductase [Rhodococcus oxybenzonivorans]AWK71695.1 cyclohexanone monooxygenase [Rhodococcus oxybenzonivorans]